MPQFLYKSLVWVLIHSFIMPHYAWASFTVRVYEEGELVSRTFQTTSGAPIRAEFQGDVYLDDVDVDAPFTLTTDGILHIDKRPLRFTQNVFFEAAVVKRKALLVALANCNISTSGDFRNYKTAFMYVNGAFSLNVGKKWVDAGKIYSHSKKVPYDLTM